MFLSFFAGFSRSTAVAYGGSIQGFHLVSCKQENCLQIDAPNAWVSSLNGSYLIPNAQLKFLRNGRQSGSILRTTSLFLDQHFVQIMLRSIDGKDRVDGYFDFDNWKLSRFSN